MGTKISYVDETWNPVTGCTKISDGCKFCYAETIAKRFWGKRKFSDVRCHPERLEQPLHWRKPRRILVPSMADLFHESVPGEFVFKVIHIAHQAHWHKFLFLTKRIKQMASFFKVYHSSLKASNKCVPAPNIHLGVTICTQKEADEILPIALQIPGFDWVSAEPLLSNISFRWKPYSHQAKGESYRQYLENMGEVNEYESLKGIKQIVVGCESGPRRRPCKLEHIRSIVEQCQAAGVKCFVKQIPIATKTHRVMVYDNFGPEDYHYKDEVDAFRVSHDPKEWPKWAQVREPICRIN